mgnify:CR=1 FL=1
MYEDLTRKRVFVNDCDEVIWLVMRYNDRQEDHEDEQLLALARSMLRPIDADGQLTFDPTGEAHAFQKEKLKFSGTDLSVGQIQPIQVFAYPQEMIGGLTHKKYGIICGNRRWKAACLLNRREGRPLITELDARVFILTKEEYDNNETQFHFMLMTFQENDQRKQMHILDRCQRMREMEERYYEIIDRKIAQRPGRRPHATANVKIPDAVIPPEKDEVASAQHGNGKAQKSEPFTSYMHRQTGRHKSAIRQEVQIGRKLASSLFDVWHRENLPYGAIRALVPLPANAQIEIVKRLIKTGKTITETRIRDAVLEHREKIEDAADAAESEGTALVGLDGTSVPKRVAQIKISCDHCARCQVLYGDPAKCRPYAAMILGLQVAAQICCDLELRVRLSNPKAIELLRQPADSLAIAADSLNQFLADPESFRDFSPLALASPEAADAPTQTQGV